MRNVMEELAIQLVRVAAIREKSGQVSGARVTTDLSRQDMTIALDNGVSAIGANDQEAAAKAVTALQAFT